ncbi:hypothetical protein Tco_0375638 [Tanacetum coccineum]
MGFTNTPLSAGATGSSAPPPRSQAAPRAPTFSHGPLNVPQGCPNRGLRCFNFGEFGQRQSDCRNPKFANCGLFTVAQKSDSAPISDYVPVYDEYPEDLTEEYVSSDIGPLLMLHREFLTHRAPENDWLRHNLFHLTCTISGKVCTFIIDVGSCENVISEVAVSKLNLPTEEHPKPYRLSWLSQIKDVVVSKRVVTIDNFPS